ncbi:response regulator [Caenispirillum salinarum]|uniref:response regulator n=1 Tax=Caenispirillum salinarum TaxID=859058 RepID=UPI00384BD1A3
MSSQTQTAGGPTAPSAAPDGVDAEAGPLCESVNDLYQPAARLMIGRLLAPFLEGHHATPTELLHSPTLQKHVEGDRHWQGALQRAADIQAKQLGIKPSDRIGTLTALAAKAQKRTRARITEKKPPEARPGGYSDQVAALRQAAGDEAEAAFLADSALTQYLQGGRDWGEKTERILALCEGESLSAEAKARVDQVLGEVLRAGGAIHDICERVDPINMVLEDLLVMAGVLAPETPLLEPDPPGGKAPPERTRIDQVLRLRAVLADEGMERARAGLMAALHHELSRRDRLLPSMAGDAYGGGQLLAELQLISRLAQALKPGGHVFLGGHATADAIEKRVARIVSTGALQDMLAGKTVLEKVETLFDMQKMVFGAYARKIVEEYLRSFLEDRDFAGRLLDSSKTRLRKLRSVADVQRRVKASLFPAEERVNWATMLDQVQLTFIRTNQVFAPFEKDKPPPQKVLETLDLCAEGAFTEGECVKRARAHLTRYAQRPTVIREFLAGASDSAEGAKRLALLGEKMRAAGVPFVDVTRMRVMVVEDEEASASYIRMVLSDMGVSQITSAEDGHEALDLFAEQDDAFDLVISDWMMPRMSGIDLLKQVRSTHPKLPFLMVTALATQPAVEEAMAHDVTAYIAKPFPPEQLEEKVMVLMNRGHRGPEGRKG